MPNGTPSHGLLALAARPNLVLVLASVGLCLLFVEINRPGRILPAVAGLLLTLFAVAALLRVGMQPWAGALILCCAAVFLFNVWRPMPAFVLALTAVLGVVGLRCLLQPSAATPIHLPIAILCGGFLGSLSALLSRFAYRARRSKALD